MKTLFFLISVYEAQPIISRNEGFFTTTPQVILEGHNPVFHCYANGWPTPSFTWFKEGEELKSGDAMNSYVLTRRTDGLDLEILYVRQQVHAGLYTCLVKNKFGEERHDIRLVVEGPFFKSDPQ